MNEDKCLICGETVPEGRIVCHMCNLKYGLESPTGRTGTINQKKEDIFKSAEDNGKSGDNS